MIATASAEKVSARLSAVKGSPLRGADLSGLTYEERP